MAGSKATTAAGATIATAPLVALLREIADGSGGLVQLRPGLSDARMDAWAAPVPEEIRVLLREVGGIRIAYSRRKDNDTYLCSEIDFDEPLNDGTDPAGGDGSWYVEQAGGPGTHRFVHLDEGDGFFYVDVDRETGSWGPVFMFWDANDAALLDSSLTAWLHRTAHCLREALRGADGDAYTFNSAFQETWTEPQRNAPQVPTVPAADARTSPDPVIRSVATALPDDGALADLREVDGAALVIFDFPELCHFGRAHGGTVLTAVPSNPYEDD
ncbi:hypothetical protein ACFUN8_13815 [Streptomyces sp. NPDC057307]|uniref:hypothetical protein n=1 Tax=Streptomyces sp. NPDC057307 TaxID=3346096 RepID=UPI00362957C1